MKEGEFCSEGKVIAGEGESWSQPAVVGGTRGRTFGLCVCEVGGREEKVELGFRK